MKHDFIITPFVSVGPIHFGDTKDQVIKILNSPIKELKTRFGKVKFEYPGFNIIFENDVVVEMNFLSQINLQINEHKIFNDNNIINYLKSFDADPRKIHDSLVFDKIGIALSGFEIINETQIVNVFKKGYWDQVI